MRIPKSARAKATLSRLGAAVVLAALCGGCGSQTGGSAVPAETAAVGTTTTVRMATPPKDTKKPSSGLPSAADGTNLDACANGNCEIQVDGPTTIPVPGYSRISNVQIKQISPGSVTATTTVFGLPVSGSTGVGGTIFLNGLTVKIVAVQGSSAVLRLSTS
ncbi:hypothetical protein [Nocardia aurantiaca]|uniref:Lipoprotein n=1 Tax=Nocardia aurantiaca TaxID=2675850 RepID=A0A6I3L223_9NOCA|nr:hypothetical protein [Nocardia aurantiaca]MTE13899.1 hypothetical protein [Nocardia aurantiaca]